MRRVGYIAFINNSIVPIMINSHLEENLLNNILLSYASKNPFTIILQNQKKYDIIKPECRISALYYISIPYLLTNCKQSSYFMNFSQDGGAI